MNRVQRVDRTVPINESVELEPGDLVVTLTEEELAEVEKLLLGESSSDVKYLASLFKERRNCFVSIATPGEGYGFNVKDGGYSTMDFTGKAIRVVEHETAGDPDSPMFEGVLIENIRIESGDDAKTVFNCIADVEDLDTGRRWNGVSVVLTMKK